MSSFTDLMHPLTLLDEAKEKRDEVYGDRHEGHLSHELVAGGAAFEAMKKWEDSQRRNGTSPSNR